MLQNWLQDRHSKRNEQWQKFETNRKANDTSVCFIIKVNFISSFFRIISYSWQPVVRMFRPPLSMKYAAEAERRKYLTERPKRHTAVPSAQARRFIAAMNKNLQYMMKQGLFREDLYYRLHVITVKIPPLRERREDIAILTNHFLSKFNNLYGFRKYFHFKTMKAFSEYSWSGNVHELQNIVESLVITLDNNAIYPTDLPQKFNVKASPVRKDAGRFSTDLRRTLEQIEKEIIIDPLRNSPAAEEAAVALGISQSTMVRKMQKCNLKLVTDKKLENPSFCQVTSHYEGN